MPTTRYAALALALALGCQVGTTTSTYQPAKGPAGADIELELTGGKEIRGELLAVEPNRLLVLENGRLVRVASSSLKEIEAPKVRHSGSDLPDGVRERLRLISRYPQGVSAEPEQRLLAAYGQDAVAEVP